MASQSNSKFFTLLVIDSHPVQYRVPIYRELATKLKALGGRFHVIYGSNSSVRGAMDTGFGQAVTWDEPMLEGYSYEFLPNAESETPGQFTGLRGAGIEGRLREIAPDAVFLNGLNYLLMMRALVSARMAGIKVWLRSETQDFAFARSASKSLIRHAIYRLAYSQIKFFLPIGKLNAEHYRTHGVKAKQMEFCHYCVVDRFKGEPEENQVRRIAKRADLGISPDRLVVMFSGKLIPKKYPAVLLEGWQLLSDELKRQYTLLFVGSGEQLEELKESASRLGAHAIFPGFVNQSQIADFYLASDAVILPSRQMGETWGLVANEALLATKPVILSKNAGSSVDFEGFYGVQVVDPTASEVATALAKLPDIEPTEQIRNQMSEYTIEAAVAGILTLCKKQSS